MMKALIFGAVLGILAAAAAMGRNERRLTTQAPPGPKSDIRAAAPILPFVPEWAPARSAPVRARLGDELRVEFSRDGRLASIRGRIGSGTPAAGGFDPRSGRQSLARALEILELTRELIGVSDEFPLAAGEVRPGEFSSQVYFFQTSRGSIPVEPGGKVSVSLGSRGELIGLDSDYRADLEGDGGARSISPAAAAFSVQSALEAEGQRGAAARISQGRSVLWAGQGSRPRPAYEYFADGRRYFVDAQDGRILARRDERQFGLQSPSDDVSESRRNASAPAAAGDCVRCAR